MFGARHNLRQGRQHLTAVTNPQGQGIHPLEEANELIPCPAVEQDGLGPALTRSQHVPIGETTTSGNELKLIQGHATFDDIAHVNIDRSEAGPIKGRRHLNLAVNTLLPQDRGLGTRSEEHTSELQSRPHLVCRLLLEKKKKTVCTTDVMYTSPRAQT